MGIARTVRGDISTSELGQTLAHEHLYCDFSVVSGKTDNRIQDCQLVADELALFKAAGGQTIFELTPQGVGADSSALKRISETAGVNIIQGTALYIEETHPAWVRSASVEDIAGFFVANIEKGHDGIRAGLIGEIASHNDVYPRDYPYYLRESEQRVFKAAALAQQRTGAAISTHASKGRAGHAQLDILEAAGADLSRVVIGHCDTYINEDESADFDYYLPILKRGAGVQFDLIGWREPYQLSPTNEQKAQRLATLVERGYLDQLTLSTDTCRLSQLHVNGGRGFAYLWTTFLPILRENGVTDDQVQRMLVDNPMRLATIN